MFTNPLEVTIVSFLITLLGAIVWWWFRRVVGSLDAATARQQELALSIAKICGTMTAIAQWQEYHEKTDADRHASQVLSLERLTDNLERHRTDVTHRIAIVAEERCERGDHGAQY